MIKLAKIPRVIFASVLALAMWTFISVNTSTFVAEDEFDYFQYILSYVISVGAWAVIAFDFNIMPRFKRGIGIGLFALTPFFCMHISMILSGSAEFLMNIYFINVLFYFAVLVLFFALTQSMKWSAVITLLLSYVFNLASFVVNLLRGTPLIPSDFLAIQTAANVAENYTFTMQYQIVVVTVLTAFLTALLCVFGYKLPLTTWKRRLTAALSGLAVFLVFYIPVLNTDFSAVSMDYFDQYHANNTHGTLYSFYVNLRRMKLEKPEGYSQEETQKAIESVPADTAPIPTDKPNIIVIMNESFADLSVLGDLRTNEDFMPYYRSLEKNTIKGELLVSPFGGYTCNTEFEFLTGLSMGLLPRGSAPYLQYIRHDQPTSFASYMKTLGYKSVAVHPYFARCWNREKVYKYFGFDNFVSIENMGEYENANQFEYIRNYMSDRTSYSAVITQLEEKDDDERMFVFNVTMQNHGGYTYNNPGLDEHITIENLEGDYPEAEQYLSLIRESDKELEELLYYFENWDEPVIITMFGDHQPAVEQDFYEELMGGPISGMSGEKLQTRYRIPFIIWANYDIDEKTDIKTSPNYLSNLVLETAGLPKSKTGVILDEIKEEVPQINEMGHFTPEGKWQPNNEEKSEALKRYADMEYYILTNKPAAEKNDEK